MTVGREMADHPGLVGVCYQCGERPNGRRHIKSINGRYYVVCYDGSAALVLSVDILEIIGDCS